MRARYLPETPEEWTAYQAGLALGNEAATFAFVGLAAPVKIKIDTTLRDDEGCLCISPEHKLLAHISPMMIEWVVEDSSSL